MSKQFLIASGLFILIFSPVSASAGDKGRATIRGTSEGVSVSGNVTFEETPEGLKVRADLSHLGPGRHGFHIHEFADCGDSGKAAGNHYNPDGMLHGFLPKDGYLQAHAGDLGNITIAPDGTGSVELVIANLTLSGGKYSVGGRSVVVHENEDTFAQPAGNAGGRIGCGEILIVGD